YVTDAWNLAEVLLKAREMAQVNGFDDEVDVDGAVGGGACLDAANVGSVFGNDGGEFLEKAGAVVDREGELDGVSCRLRAGGVLAAALRLGPLDLDAPVSLVQEILHVRAASCVYGDTFAPRDITDDFFAA